MEKESEKINKKDFYYICDECKEKCVTLYYNKERGLRLCESCEFSDEIEY